MTRKMTKERKWQLVYNLEEYLDNRNVDFEEIGIDDDTSTDERYYICLGYIVELVDTDDEQYFWEKVIGFTKEELIAEGMEWVYE